MKKEEFVKITPEMVERVRDLLYRGNCSGAYTAGERSWCSSCPFACSNSTSHKGCVVSGRSHGHTFKGKDVLLMRSCEEFLQIAKEIYPDNGGRVIKSPKFDTKKKEWAEEEMASNELISNIKKALMSTFDNEKAMHDVWEVIRKHERDQYIKHCKSVQNAMMVCLRPGSWKGDVPEVVFVMIGSPEGYQIIDISIREIPLGCLIFDLINDFTLEEVNEMLSRFHHEEVLTALYSLEWVR